MAEFPDLPTNLQEHPSQSSTNHVSPQVHVDLMNSIIDHNHPLYVHPSDIPGSILISQILTGSENYALWSRGMKIALLAKNKLGFVESTCLRSHFDPSLRNLWDRCNALVLSWIVNTVSKELYSGIVYANDACRVWNDLKEMFDKVNVIRIFFLHKEIGICHQGVGSVSAYYTKLRHLWGEYASLVPTPSCDCQQSKQYAHQVQQQQLLQFLNGLNESYNPVRSQILLMSPLPSLNQAYAMIIQEEMQRANVALYSVNNEQNHGATFTVKGPSNKQAKDSNIVCSYCHVKGHKRENCYRLVGYPSDFRFKGKRNQNQPRFKNTAADVGIHSLQVHEDKQPGENQRENNQVMDCKAEKREVCLDKTAVVPFTQEMYHQFKLLLSKDSSSCTTGSLKWSEEADW